ncbi:hypothetical protein [Candidatus Electronema sp. JM]
MRLLFLRLAECSQTEEEKGIGKNIRHVLDAGRGKQAGEGGAG